LIVASQSVVITGPQGTEPLRSVAGCADLGEDRILVGQLDLDQLTVLGSRARLVVGDDTRKAHLASALATPSMILLWPTS
jgi:ADP-heptose:LPS heptosyltransferase